MTDDNNTKLIHVKIEISENAIIEGAKYILSVIRPKWKADDIKFKVLTDGITNKLVACCDTADFSRGDILLIRIYGNKTEKIIDREKEIRYMQIMYKSGLGCQLYGTFDNGLIAAYLPGVTLNPETVLIPHLYKLIARKMAQLHRAQTCPLDTEPVLWGFMDKFFKLTAEKFENAELEKRYTALIPSKAKLRDEIDDLKRYLTDLNNPIVFAHNDLLLGNIIYNELDGSMHFIDLEYAGFNYQAFDIGNHFAEFAGVGTNLDYSKYPSKEFQLGWLKEYLTAFLGKRPTSEQIEDLYINVNKFTLASHFLWGMWAIIQAEISHIDFDFIGYAHVRLQEYFDRKESFLAL